MVENVLYENKTNHPISSNSNPSATKNKSMVLAKKKGGGVTKLKGRYKILTKYEAAVSENHSSSGMLIILIKVQTVCI